MATTEHVYLPLVDTVDTDTNRLDVDAMAKTWNQKKIWKRHRYVNCYHYTHGCHKIRHYLRISTVRQIV